ncbi:MAG: hypothetical protein JW712_00270 [Dehalococcoidales bacterium]|nr:hypothetical protein [Dehalococcoidales bacterium]
MDIDKRILQAVVNTEIIRAPRQNLYTFGTTNIYYYLVTVPAYSELTGGPTETVVREGRVIAERPKIVTPYYLSNLEGFSQEARQYFQALIEEFGERSVHGLVYAYKNEPKEMNIVSNDLRSVVDKLNEEIDKREDKLSAIIKGEDTLWDVSLMKFIFEVTRTSAPHNFKQLETRGLLEMDSRGTPRGVRDKINDLFEEVGNGEREAGELKEELERWGLFEEYQDRFFSLFKR